MKNLITTFLFAATTFTAAHGQTLHIAPMYAGGTATFEVQNGSPGTTAIIGYSLHGSGPFTLANGLTLNLSAPFNRLSPFSLDALGNGTLGPFPMPSRAVVGMRVWFQGVQVDMLANPIYSVTNMVPMTVQSPSTPPGMVAIPGGTFEMGNHGGGNWPDEQPVHSVTLDAFYMDTYEVSNTQFVDFLNASNVSVTGSDVYQVGGAGKLILNLSHGINYSSGIFSFDAGKDHQPAAYLTWYGATLYCNYISTVNGRALCYDAITFACDFTADGFRLPTEAEWEYASRGGDHNPYYEFPWGSDSYIGSEVNGLFSNYDRTIDVGSYAANGYGLYDMAGNVGEWCNDWYDSGYYAISPTASPTGPAGGSERVLRGGGFQAPPPYLRCSSRQSYYPTRNFNNIGFRVAAVQ